VHVSAGAAPDWFFLYLDGMTRVFPPWDIQIGGYNIPPTFWAGPAFLPVFYLIAGSYPWLERRLTKDNAHHNLLQRPRDAPVRTALGAMAVSFYTVLALSGSNDQIAFFFRVSLNATIWAGRIGLRLPHGEFIEIHQPLAGTNGNGKPVPLPYQGAPVPKRMNGLGASGKPPAASLLTPDPAEETIALERARTEESAAEISSNGHHARVTERESRAERHATTIEGRGAEP